MDQMQNTSSWSNQRSKPTFLWIRQHLPILHTPVLSLERAAFLTESALGARTGFSSIHVPTERVRVGG